MMKRILLGLLLSLTLTALAACGDSSSHTNTSATLKVNLTGDLAGKSISGTTFTLTLPPHVTPATVNGAVATDVVTLSGTFAGGTLAQTTYTPATNTTNGTLQIIAPNSVNPGVTTVGEVATITLQLANGAAPGTTDFPLSAVSVFDTLGTTISGMSAIVSGVTLQ